MKDEELITIMKRAETDEIWKSYFFYQIANIEKPELWLKTLKEKGFFEPRHNPKPQLDEKGGYKIPYWTVLGYLSNLSERNKTLKDDDVTNKIKETIDSVISYKDSDGNRVKNIRTDWVMIKLIFNLPVSKISDAHLEFLKIVLESSDDGSFFAGELVEKVFPTLIDNKEKTLLLKLTDIILGYKRDEKSYFSKLVSVIGDYWLSELMGKNKDNLFAVCGMELYPIVMAKMRSILSEKEKDEFGSLITIEDSSQNLAENYYAQLVSVLRDLLIFGKPKLIRPIINNLMAETQPIFNRLAIFVISYYYEDLNEIFWAFKSNPIESIELKHELFELFKNNCKSFTKNQIGTIIDWIENENVARYDTFYKDKTEREKSIAYHRKEWLLAIQSSGDERVAKLFDKYDKMYPVKVDHPGYLVWTSSVKISSIGETEKFDDFLSKPNGIIAQYITTRVTGTKLSESMSPENLGWLVQKNPAKFSVDLDPFLSVPRDFQRAILGGLRTAWRSGKDFDWSDLLNFGLKIITDDAFWAEPYESSCNYGELITQELANLIEAGTKDDNHAFAKSYLPAAENILIVLAKKDRSHLRPSGDLVNSVLNSPKGSIFSAMINCSLRESRLEKKPVWSEDLKDFFERSIKFEITPSKELFTVIGLYFSNLLYLDREWVKANINHIFPKDVDEYWKPAFVGYLFGANRLYSDVYTVLKENGHYSKALKTEFEDSFSNNRISEHIGIAYLNNMEQLDDPNGMLTILVSKQNLSLILDLVHFFRRLRAKLSLEQKKKIIPLWKQIAETLKGLESEDVSQIFASLFHWIAFVDEIDEQASQLLKLSAKNIRSEPDKHFVVEMLLGHLENKPDKVGQIFLEMLRSGAVPFYKAENIQKIVSTLYEKQEKTIADEICQIYWNKELFFLQEIYNGYNPL